MSCTIVARLDSLPEGENILHLLGSYMSGVTGWLCWHLLAPVDTCCQPSLMPYASGESIHNGFVLLFFFLDGVSWWREGFVRWTRYLYTDGVNGLHLWMVTVKSV